MKFSFPKFKKRHLKQASSITFWFCAGALISLFLILGFSYITFQRLHEGKIYPGIKINGIDFGGKTEQEVKDYFLEKNAQASDAAFAFNFEEKVATISAKEIDFGYDENLLTYQALSIGRTNDPITNLSLIIQAYTSGLDLSPSYKLSEEKLYSELNTLIDFIDKKPVEAVFTFENGRVTEFKPSEDGREIDKNELGQQILSKARLILNYTSQKIVIIPIPIKIIEPNLTTDKVNKMGIRELIGSGTSLFAHSIESRIYNINLAASRLNGILVAPGETFSFAEAIGDISAYTGYKQAFIISGGKTILGDGGGVCQVSTTLFRAALNSGLPIEERTAHAYRVSYYEQDSLPGLDATVYVPSVDLKFRNDTGHHILIQALVDPRALRLTFNLYGTKDGRITEIGTPVITSQTPAPEPKYEDDPTLPKGEIKQVDFAAAGAKVYFTRKVTKNGEVLISETFNSNFRPWQAVFLRGTKE
ncbi:MAG: VanW family protein [Candidatus Levybacteria bacterium]|nr:VanW family protein [Candidatus Levybacteria bacterium]